MWVSWYDRWGCFYQKSGYFWGRVRPATAMSADDILVLIQIIHFILFKGSWGCCGGLHIVRRFWWECSGGWDLRCHFRHFRPSNDPAGGFMRLTALYIDHNSLLCQLDPPGTVFVRPKLSSSFFYSDSATFSNCRLKSPLYFYEKYSH